ncbi:MAG: cation:proton antiporter, partial [Dehalococcoidia bacterium]|nr:cation:proton antiporter [Dehalococcoidia bacterium]
ALIGGPIQIVATVAVVAVFGSFLALPIAQAIFLGGLVALSSTLVVLKTLMDRGELDSLHGRVLIGLLIVQDLAVVPLMIILPALATPQDNFIVSVGKSILQAAVVLGTVLVIGSRVIPRLMSKIAETRSAELFLLTVIVLCLGAAFGLSFLGLPLAIGAFIAGLTISESSFSQQALADIIPLRNTFAALFFASIGMLTDPRFVSDNFSLILLLVAVITFGKWLIAMLVTLACRYSVKTSFLVGLGMIQIGEFSFVMAREGVNLGAIPEYLYSLTMAAAIITIVLTPSALSAGPPIYLYLSRTRLGRSLLQVRPEPTLPVRGMKLVNHVVICGFGRIGRELASVLDRREFAYFVVDYDPHTIVELRKRGIPCIYGDAANPEVLRHVQLEKARVLVVTMGDSISARQAVSNAAVINPKLDIVTRVQSEADLDFFRNAPAREFVNPEFEASLEIIRHTLHRFGVTSQEIQYQLNTMREQYYAARPKEE